MTTVEFWALLRLFLWISKRLKNLSPEQKEAWAKAIKEMPMPDDLDPEHGMGGQ